MQENNEARNVEDIKKDAAELVQKSADLFTESAGLAANFISDRVKDAGNFFGRVNDELHQTTEQRALERYRPVFENDLAEGNCQTPAILNVVSEYEKKSQSVFPEAIGFQQVINDKDILSVSLNDINKYNVILKPEKSEALYYVHPVEKNVYICIDDYFKYLTTARITELKDIAHSLGATYVAIAIFEKEKTFSAKKVKGSGLLGFGRDKIGSDAEKDTEKTEIVQIGATIEARFEKKDPEEPVLRLFANDESIQNLVKHVLTQEGKQTFEKLRLDYNVSSGIKEKDAMKLDGVLKKLKFQLNGSIVDEAKKESNRHFEYTIEF